jgi:hypothetical protein
VELLRFVAAMREATWALMAAPVLAGTTTPDGDDDFYENYMSDYLRLARERVAASDFYELMKTAAGENSEPRSW